MNARMKYFVGDDVLYFRRGIAYQATVREDLGVLRGAGRRYRITTRDDGDQLEYFVFDVAERFLDKEFFARFEEE